MYETFALTDYVSRSRFGSTGIPEDLAIAVLRDVFPDDRQVPCEVNKTFYFN